MIGLAGAEIAARRIGADAVRDALVAGVRGQDDNVVGPDVDLPVFFAAEMHLAPVGNAPIGESSNGNAPSGKCRCTTYRPAVRRECALDRLSRSGDPV